MGVIFTHVDMQTFPSYPIAFPAIVFVTPLCYRCNIYLRDET